MEICASLEPTQITKKDSGWIQTEKIKKLSRDVAGYLGAGSPDLDLAMAVEMSQLYTKRDKSVDQSNCQVSDGESNAEEEEEISMAIELSLKEVQKRNRQTRFSAESMSTDGAEGELAKNVQEQVTPECFQISKEANATVR